MGLLIAVGWLGLGNGPTAALTFALAYGAGFALTVGPLVQAGESVKTALWDALWSETASITVMEVVAIGVNLWIAGEATLGTPRFWLAMVVSLTAGLIAAYPVNLALIAWGVKGGMHDPRHGAHG